MSGGVYKNIKVDMLSSGYNWAAKTLVAYLIAGSYTPNFTTDTTVASLPSGSILAGPATLTSLTATTGVAFAANLDFGTITTSGPIEAIIIADATSAGGTPSAAQLVLYLDVGIGFGQTVEAQDCQIIWDTRGIWSP